jgi:tRNA splicing endonuclease
MSPVRVIGAHGVLFKVDTSCQETRKYSKRAVNSALSIEELHYLSKTHPLSFDCPYAEQLYHCLLELDEVRRHCEAYLFLVNECGFALRHGGRFGADFIGYRNRDDHGTHLVCVAKSRLDTVGLSRVACSVRKEVLLVAQDPNLRWFTLRYFSLHLKSGFS